MAVPSFQASRRDGLIFESYTCRFAVMMMAMVQMISLMSKIVQTQAMWNFLLTIINKIGLSHVLNKKDFSTLSTHHPGFGDPPCQVGTSMFQPMERHGLRRRHHHTPWQMWTPCSLGAHWKHVNVYKYLYLPIFRSLWCTNVCILCTWYLGFHFWNLAFVQACLLLIKLFMGVVVVITIITMIIVRHFQFMESASLSLPNVQRKPPKSNSRYTITCATYSAGQAMLWVDCSVVRKISHGKLFEPSRLPQKSKEIWCNPTFEFSCSYFNKKHLGSTKIPHLNQR